MQFITEFLSGSSPAVYLFIFFGKLLEVALATLRTQLIIKGQRIPGAIAAALEYTFWLCITASAITGFQEDPLKIVILVIAFALGQVLGSVIEEKLALGYCMITAIFMDQKLAHKAEQALRENGQALTMFPAEGMDGAKRMELMTTAKRKDVPAIRDLLNEVDPAVVVTVQAMQQVSGATFGKTFK